MATENLSKSEAAAELYLRTLEDMSTIDSAWRKSGTNIVCATTSGYGPHLGNFAADFDADVHLICESRDPVSGNGPTLPVLPDSEHGPIYFNVSVRGINEDAEGYSLPTHTVTPKGANISIDIDSEIQSLAITAGVPDIS
jgi:hypothetical protein